jgi:hypothetical protein
MSSSTEDIRIKSLKINYLRSLISMSQPRQKGHNILAALFQHRFESQDQIDPFDD